MFNLDNLTDEQIVMAKMKCERSLLYFTRFFFKVLRGNKFIINWHHETICDELENTAKYDYNLLNINIPPRFSKTELVGINFIAWSLAKNPRANFLYVTGSDELRSETSIRVRDIITHPLYIKMFDIEIKKDQSGKNLWRTKQGGGLKTATIFGQITGFGAGRMIEQAEYINEIRLFEGAIILDDINKIMDAIANSALNVKANDVILNTILSRKNSEDTPLVNIQQRAGMNDATRTLLDFYRDSKKVCDLVIPIINDNVPLWSFKNSNESIERLKNDPKTKPIFDTQYMQNPVFTEGVLFPLEKLMRFDLSKLNLDNVEARIGIIDTADEGTDLFSFPIIYKIAEKYYIVDVMHTDESFEITKPLSISKGLKHQLDYIKVETNSQGKDYYRYLKNELPESTIRGVWSVQNKETRILMQSEWIIQNFYFRNDYEHDSQYALFIEHLTSYLKLVKNQKDDSADVMAAASQFIKKLFGLR